jgi:hypothetical protein
MQLSDAARKPYFKREAKRYATEKAVYWTAAGGRARIVDKFTE